MWVFNLQDVNNWWEGRYTAEEKLLYCVAENLHQLHGLQLVKDTLVVCFRVFRLNTQIKHRLSVLESVITWRRVDKQPEDPPESRQQLQLMRSESYQLLTSCIPELNTTTRNAIGPFLNTVTHFAVIGWNNAHVEKGESP